VGTSTTLVRRILGLGIIVGVTFVAGCSSSVAPVAAPPPAAATAPTPEPPAPTAVPVVPTPAPAPPTVAPTAPPTLVPTIAPTPIPAVPTVAPLPKPQPAEPVSISIPRFATRGDILAMGMEDDGVTMAAPTDPDIIGWYDFSAKVGVPGNAVVVGHVDYYGQLRAFGKLRQMNAGDVIELQDSLERNLKYRVQSVEVVPYTTPPAEFLTQSGPHEELTLITCGGAFDKATRNYLSRVIVRAIRDVENEPQASAGGND